MTFKKRIVLTGYQVTYQDRRQTPPRSDISETYIVDSDFIRSAATVSANITDLIKKRYESQGFCVCSISKIAGKRTVFADLEQLWKSAADWDPAPEDNGGVENG